MVAKMEFNRGSLFSVQPFGLDNKKCCLDENWLQKLSAFSPNGNMRAGIIPKVRPVIKVTTSIPIVRVWAYIQDWNEIALLGMLCVLRPLQHWSTTSSVCPSAQCGKTRNLLSIEKKIVKTTCSIKSIMLIWRNFCGKMVRVNFRNFYNVVGCLFCIYAIKAIYWLVSV